MPKRQDIQTILLLGAGPIVIGQACEFDYSGSQACRALKEEGYRVVLVNSNPATIMTDPGLADATYIEPVTWSFVKKIIEKERPDALLPTMGGQTALNCALDLVREGVLEEYGVELIGATKEAIDKAEDRQLFREAMHRIGLKTPRSGLAHSMQDAWDILEEVGFPAVIRPSFTMGGSGGGIAYNRNEYEQICRYGLELSPTTELLIDESIMGWKEFELEVVRDCRDNTIIICSIENLDPMGVHTGDSITVAPAQTLTDKEYQVLRDASLAVLREVGVETGGSNVQFAVNPDNGEVMVIEMNPRVSRSSALASKATGFPIAKVAAKLAVGYCLDELSNDITGGRTPASFEPTIDYVVTKVPRFNFEKFPGANTRLTTQMKSVGEAMAIGRTFQESLQKALRSLESGLDGLTPIVDEHEASCDMGIRVKSDRIKKECRSPGPDRLLYIAEAFRQGFSVYELMELTGIDEWFLVQISELICIEKEVGALTDVSLSKEQVFFLKQKGFSDHRLATLLGVSESLFREYRQSFNVRPVYKRVDTCAAEFAIDTAYMYSTYEQENECVPSQREKVMVLGGGPNRIGQGLEFDYCCVHAAQAMREEGYETIMVNCNPETVSTDYDSVDRLYFEPVTLEDVLEIIDIEQPKGVIIQYGGQTPLKLAFALQQAGVPILGTSPDAIDQAEDRERFQALCNELELKQPPNGTVRSVEEGIRLAKVFAYPLIVRPSYVLGGRDMRVVYYEEELIRYMKQATEISEDRPLLLDHFLDDAIEVDVDAVCDGDEVLVGGVLEHIEQAGVHSGDSCCTLPPYSLSMELIDKIKEQVGLMALHLRVVGLINVQFAIKGSELYVLEVNPRASRTVPFIAKATGVSLAQVAARAMVGVSLREQGLLSLKEKPYFSVKKPVFPFNKFLDVDPILGPEMRSTGEVMGVGTTVGQAFARVQSAVSKPMPRSGVAFLSVRDTDKDKLKVVAKNLLKQGFELVATRGTAASLQLANIPCAIVNKVMEGRPNIVDKIKNNEIAFIINTTEGEQAVLDSSAIRSSAILHDVCYTTTLAGADAACMAMQQEGVEKVCSLQDLYEQT